MNFLAHFHLAWPDTGLVAGALEGDYYKGPLRGDLPAPMERGVRLHRAIDAFTDDHPALLELRRRFPQDSRRYAGILVDLCFDHYLSAHWDRFSNIPRDEFNAGVYRTLAAEQGTLSERAQHMSQRLEEHDLLGLYARWDTVPASAQRIGQRFRRSNPFEQAGETLAPLRGHIEEAFLGFYPELQQFSAETIERLNQSGAQVSNVAPGDKYPQS